ncbi:hypothetical protein PTB13_27035, partial [Bacillus sp. MHSD17]|nr:hypothetical protein [Bacillus sp. MHSD17]
MLKRNSCRSRRPSGLRKTNVRSNSLAHRTTWLRSDLITQPTTPTNIHASENMLSFNVKKKL